MLNAVSKQNRNNPMNQSQIYDFAFMCLAEFKCIIFNVYLSNREYNERERTFQDRLYHICAGNT